MNYSLKDKRLSVDDKRNDMLQMYLNSIHSAVNAENESVFNKVEGEYTSFGRAFFGLLAEITSPYHTSEDYVNQKAKVLFDE
jgi:hypothetical protein